MRRLGSIVLLVALFATTSVAPASEAPQTYAVSVCSSSLGPVAPVSWVASGDPEVVFDQCATGGGFGISSGPGFFDWSFTAPEDTEVAGLRIWRTGGLNNGGSYGLTATGAGQTLGLEGAPQLATPADGREFPDLHARALTISLSCFLDCPVGANWVRFTRMEMVMRDTLDPRLQNAEGPLLAGGALAGQVSVRTSFADVGGGARRVDLLVDGAVAINGPPRCAEPYVSAVPCPLSAGQDLVLDTRLVADGPHTVRFAVTDVAGNRSVSRGFPIVVDNVPDTPAPQAQPPVMRLTVEWKTVKAAYGERPTVRAVLRDGAGKPVAGARVGVAIRAAARGAAFVPDTPRVSDARGRVQVRLPKGPSRDVRFSYGTSTATSRVKVRAPLRFDVSPRTTYNGRSIRLYGSVAGASAPAAVELQARSGKRWVPVKTVALRQGRFSARYEFGYTFRPTRYAFRAVVHRDARLPYEPATSTVRRVLVRP
jgi:hypothetical protein